jgi:hypothetical protein
MTILEMGKDDVKTRLEAYDKEVQGRLWDDGFECRHKMENAFSIDDEDEDQDMEPIDPSSRQKDMMNMWEHK